MKQFLCSFLVFSVTKLHAQTNLNWTPIAPGIWNATIDKSDQLTFYTVAGVQLKPDALKAMEQVNFPLAKMN